jgi:hypothetical protein
LDSENKSIQKLTCKFYKNLARESELAKYKIATTPAFKVLLKNIKNISTVK